MTAAVRLETRDMEFVAYATTPPFGSAPDAILWGSRVFTFLAWSGDLSDQEKGDRPDDVPVYREAAAVIIVDGDTHAQALAI